MLNRCFKIATLLSMLLLVCSLLMWTRSYFYSDSWRVRNAVPWRPNPWSSTNFTGWDPKRWTEGTAWVSGNGALVFWRPDYIFSRGTLRTKVYRKPAGQANWMPRSYGSVAWMLPYWCPTLMAAILPAVWLSRRRIDRGTPFAIRYGIRHFFYASTIASLVLTGYLRFGFAGALIAVETSLASMLAIHLLKTARRSESPAKYLLGVAGSASVFCALGLAWFYVDRCNHCL